ncbi:putative transcription factor bHLH041 [Senna tora]|uniref:Putative transcription factor bHLH041 n=1 Tax=Senna tora TaxID=362788 RepID=A0A834SSH2_9FABA|nr:putative transcription factor bHLH041 [Senna tora]
MHPMDAVFSLPGPARTNFLRSIAHSCACSYICLWSYQFDHSLLSNHLRFLDGLYNVGISQPSSSVVVGSTTLAQTLFNQFRGLVFDVNDDRIPGLAFKNRSHYLELQQSDLLRLAWTQIQTQFYQEARIKTAVFMGCNNGEIELGFSTISQADIQTALSNWFPDEFSRSQSSQQQHPNIDQNQNPPTSSSSSLRSLSLSTGSPECSSLLFTTINPVASSSHHFPPPETLASSSPHQQAIQALAQATTQSPFPTPVSTSDHDAIIMRAILQVISNPSPSSSTSLPPPPPPPPHQLQNPPHQDHQNLPYMGVHPEAASAFKRYRTPPITSPLMASDLRRQSLFKRSLTFFRSLNFMRMRERSVLHTTRPTSSTQLHHMISERRRREKLNENFQALRSLLPPGTKKDKASILTIAKETVSSLMAEIEKLRERNKQLEESSSSSSIMAAPPSSKEAKASSDHNHEVIIPNERLSVRVSHEPESSSSEERIIDLDVTVRGQNSQVDVLIRLLGFLRQQDQNLSLISMEANTHLAHETSFNRGSERDESAFQEAVRRVVADLAQ